jgi:cell fate regulator YaaT (PSP1 superfamily)
MTEVISVRFEGNNKVFFFDPGNLSVARGDGVIVDTAKGRNFGECVYGNHHVDDTAIVRPLRPVIRFATDEDLRRIRENKTRKTEALAHCQRRINEHGLPMKLVNVEYAFEGNKLVFHFTAETRVDFRELVKEMASTFKARIEMRQIGVRDEARMIGGLGICGQPFCCSRFLRGFHPVSIKMAKVQGLPLNPAKISGACGRLMCCLKYEEAAYVDIVKRSPKTGSFVETPYGKGTITSVNLLRGYAKVRLEDAGDSATLKTLNFDEMIVLGGKTKRAEYIAARAAGRLAEAGFSEQPPPELLALAKPDDHDKLDGVLASLTLRNGAQMDDRSRQGRSRGGAAAPGPVKPAAPKPAQKPREAGVKAAPAKATRPHPKKNKKWRSKRTGGAGKSKPPSDAE